MSAFHTYIPPKCGANSGLKCHSMIDETRCEIRRQALLMGRRHDKLLQICQVRFDADEVSAQIAMDVVATAAADNKPTKRG